MTGASTAVANGQRSLSAIGEWAADLPFSVLADLGVARDRFTGGFLPPDASTVGRPASTRMLWRQLSRDGCRPG